MYFNLKPHPRHAEWLAHIFLPVDDEFLRQDMQNLLIHRYGNGAGRFDHTIHIGLRDFFVFNRHHASRIKTLDVATGDAGDHFAYLAIGHQLGFFKGTLNCIHRRLDVHHHTLLQTTGWMATHADNLKPPVRHYLCNDGDNFRRADIEADDEIFILSVFAYHPLLPCVLSFFNRPLPKLLFSAKPPL